MKNSDSYYDPPDEPEIPICEDCGQDMEVVHVRHTLPTDYKCPNPFCPSKFYGNAKEMAERLVEALDTVSELKLKNMRLKNQLERALSETEAK